MIAIGSDHGGYSLKQAIIKHLEEKNIEFKDFGCYSDDSIDYPDIAEKVCNSITGGQADKGILICGTGIGISMAANKVNGIRAALCSNEFGAKYSRMHNDANVICFGGRVIGPALACEMTDIFLETDFEGGRHSLRIEKIKNIEDNN